MFKKSLKILSCLLLPTVSLASGVIDCGVATVSSVYSQADRNDGSFHANKLLIIIGSDKKAEFNDFTFAYLENTDEAFSSVFAMALASHMAGKKLRVVVEDQPAQSNAKRISWVNIN